jgi:23S rRNA (cytosine1962-C5)-methyltransferase
LVIDAFGSTLVVDLYTRAMRERLPLLHQLLDQHFGDCRRYVRMGSDAARREGVEPLEPEAAEILFGENGLLFTVALGADQKSGFYLDQRDNRQKVARWAPGRRVLDLFCYHGGFALSALAAGADSALAVDSSQAALDAAMANGENNGLPLTTAQANIFKNMDEIAEEGPFDLIICDPPKLAPHRRDHKKAMGGYRFLIDRCLRMLSPRGILLVSSCSQAIDGEDLRLLVAQVAAKRQLHTDVLAVTGHPSDHPWPVGFTTARYLSTVAVEVRGPWAATPPDESATNN